MAKKKRGPTFPPTKNFPYRISQRLLMLSVPRRTVYECFEEMPNITPHGVRAAALRAKANERQTHAAYPYIWRLLIVRRTYKNTFTPERLEHVDRMIQAAHGTIYSKLATMKVDLKKKDTTTSSTTSKKKKAWSSTEWEKHMNYINNISQPIKYPEPPPVERGPSKPLSELLPRIEQIAILPSFKRKQSISQDIWYKDPTKVSSKALRYEPSPRVLELAKPRAIPEEI